MNEIYDNKELTLLGKIKFTLAYPDTSKYLKWTRGRMRQHMSNSRFDGWVSTLNLIDDANGQVAKYGVFSVHGDTVIYIPLGICNCNGKTIAIKSMEIKEPKVIKHILHLLKWRNR